MRIRAVPMALLMALLSTLFLWLGTESAFADTTTTASTTSTTSTTTSTTTSLTTSTSPFFPTGSITVNVSGTLKLSTSIGEVSVPFTGSMKGTSDGSGKLSFPKSGITFPPISVTIAVPAVVHISPASDFTGTVNTKTGVVTLNGSIVNAIDIAALSATGCPLGPISLHLSTANSGGVKYNSSSRIAHVADTSFIIPKITSAPASCPAAAVSTINAAFPLPVTGSTPRSIVEELSFFPPGTTAPAVESTPIATVAGESATVAPSASAAAATELPRTGSSTMPLVLIALTLLACGIALSWRRAHARGSH